MHTAVPNVSSRLVFQSRQASLQPGMDPGLAKSEDSSHGSASPSAQPQHLPPTDTQQLLTHAAAMLQHTLESASSATSHFELLSHQLSTESPPQHSQQQLGTQSPTITDLYNDVTDLQPGSAVHSRDMRGIMRLAPLLPLPSPSLQKHLTASSSVPVETPLGAHMDATDTVAHASSRQHHWQQPSVQEVSAISQSVLSAQPARLASLPEETHTRQTHGFGGGTGHTQPAPSSSHSQQRHLPEGDTPKASGVQHSAVGAARIQACLQLPPVQKRYSSATDPQIPGLMQSDDLPPRW